VSVGPLSEIVLVDGVGIHTGAKVCAIIHAYEVIEGISFHQMRGGVPARPQFVVDTSRCTKLGTEKISISTVEHLMSAFAGFGIAGAAVWVEGPELPILDGSAKGWIDAMQPALRPGFAKKGLFTESISEPIRVDGPNGSYISVTPADKLSITLTIAYEHPVIGTQTATFSEGDDYEKEIAPARTFGLRSEVDALLAAGLAKGGTLDNAIIVEEDGYSVPLRFPNELARHKLLDLLGDLYLSGSLPRADIIAVKPSHTLNVALASKLNRGL
jgi:UDP-3-O-[3-hydroxymyristoyl] N-acetylglucosamine deacetylase